MKKIPKKYEFILFPLLMSLQMSFLMSGIITFLNLGFPENFFEKWMTAFGSAFIVAFPIIMIVAPLTKKIVGKMMK